MPGVKISPAHVAKFVDHKRLQLRSGVFLLAQLDADIEQNVMAIIELKLEYSRAIKQRPGQWRETWDFRKALDEIYAVSEVDKFVQKGLWIHRRKAYLEANGNRDEHPELRWYEYTAGGTIKGAQFPGDKSRPNRSGRQREQDQPLE